MQVATEINKERKRAIHEARRIRNQKLFRQVDPGFSYANITRNVNNSNNKLIANSYDYYNQNI